MWARGQQERGETTQCRLRQPARGVTSSRRPRRMRGARATACACAWTVARRRERSPSFGMGPIAAQRFMLCQPHGG